MKEKIKAWVEGEGAKKIFFEFDGTIYQVIEADIIKESKASKLKRKIEESKSWKIISENNKYIDSDEADERAERLARLLKTDTRVTLRGNIYDIYAWL